MHHLMCMLWLLATTAQLSAKQNPQDICDIAAQRAAHTSGVPVDVLRAITRTETGRKKGGRFGPWPWTVNMEGKGVWFESEDAARVFVYKHFKRGARSFDVGCFQINYRWHHKEFSSLEEMFDPYAGATYAARFLQELHAEVGSWEKAAGAYHSRTPRHAKRYKALYKKHLAEVQNQPMPHEVVTAQILPVPERTNDYPLLRAHGRFQSSGSLVRLSDASAARGLLTTRPTGGIFP